MADNRWSLEDAGMCHPVLHAFLAEPKKFINSFFHAAHESMVKAFWASLCENYSDFDTDDDMMCGEQLRVAARVLFWARADIETLLYGSLDDGYTGGKYFFKELAEANGFAIEDMDFLV